MPGDDLRDREDVVAVLIAERRAVLRVAALLIGVAVVVEEL